MSLTQNDYLSFLQYWKQICDNSQTSIAARHLFKPDGIKALLPHIFLLEIREPEMLEVRIAGTTLDVLSKNTLTGQNYLDVCPPHERAMYWETLSALHGLPCGVVITREIIFRDKQVHVMKSFILPLIEEDTGRQYAVGLLGIVGAEEIGKAPEGGVAKSSIVDRYYVDLGHGLPAGHAPTTA